MEIELIERASRHPQRLALKAIDGQCTYGELLQVSHRVAGALNAAAGSLAGERVAFLVPPTVQYAAVQWGIWRAGAVAVPLCLSHPEPELDYVVGDCRPRALVAPRELLSRLAAIADRRGVRLLESEALLEGPTAELPQVDSRQPAMIIYTSGTTGGPKGVVSTHHNVAAQIRSLIEAWEWMGDDRILLTLPLHHVHGIVNVLGCALWAGAVCEMLPRFDAETVWRRFESSPLTLFMAVPTIYSRLLAFWEEGSVEEKGRWSQCCDRFRLMVSGSAALPLTLFRRWRDISGHELLERYGMTETGMTLSNPLLGQRRPGYVGTPLPGVQVRRSEGDRLVDDPTLPGELEVRGDGVFREYWQRPQETAQAFHDGWFRTGDIAVVKDGSYRILGRRSVDIIKTGGYKVSALEIEDVLREHPDIVDCSVVGVADDEWGERVAVLVVPVPGGRPTLAKLRDWAKQRLAPYKVPSRLLTASQLPRNALGKVIKPEVRRLFDSA